MFEQVNGGIVGCESDFLISWNQETLSVGHIDTLATINSHYFECAKPFDSYHFLSIEKGIGQSIEEGLGKRLCLLSRYTAL